MHMLFQNALFEGHLNYVSSSISTKMPIAKTYYNTYMAMELL